jgi:adenylate kinase family enzyme
MTEPGADKPDPGGGDPATTLAGRRRIVVLGTTGAGKTTLARRLAGRLGLPHIELDALYWGPGWTAIPTDLFRERAAAATASDRWVADGNYGAVRDIVWPRADLLVWLDYPLAVSFWRLTRRSLRRGLTGEELWNGNRERLRTQFLGRDSLFLWALKSHGRQRREYPAQFIRPEHAHLAVVRLRSPRAARRWLARVTEERATHGARPPARPGALDGEPG